MFFNGKVALVTGGGTGLGEACAATLAAAGAHVVVSGRTEVTLSKVAAEIRRQGGEADYCVADSALEHDVEALVDFTVTRYGSLDLAVNNAGVTNTNNPLHKIEIAEFDRIISTNLRGTFLAMRAELAFMDEHGGGAIVNMASTSALKGGSGKTPYTSGKHGIVGLTRSAALDYAERNIRVNAVAPGPIRTAILDRHPAEAQERFNRLTPMGRMGTSQEVADAVEFLLSNRASFITGIVLEVDGGYMQASRL